MPSKTAHSSRSASGASGGARLPFVERALAELKERLGEIADLQGARAVLDWDLAVWMPPGGQASRASQLGTLQSVIHGREIDDRIGELLEALEPHAGSLDPEDDDACLMRV